MNPIDRTDPSQSERLTVEFDLRQPVEKVWRALTDPDLLAEWLLPVAGFTPDPGVAFTFTTQPYPGWNGVVTCRVLEVRAHEALSYAWVVDDMGLDTVVTFRLVPTATGTHLTVEQSGFRPEQARAFGGARYGWQTMGGKLVDLLGRPS